MSSGKPGVHFAGSRDVGSTHKGRPLKLKPCHVFSGSQETIFYLRQISKVDKQAFSSSCKYFLSPRCALFGLWACGLPTGRQLTNHRDFQLLPLMDEPAFQSGAIDVLAESGHWSSGHWSQIELHGGLSSFLHFLPFSVTFHPSFNQLHPVRQVVD